MVMMKKKDKDTDNVLGGFKPSKKHLSNCTIQRDLEVLALLSSATIVLAEQ